MILISRNSEHTVAAFSLCTNTMQAKISIQRTKINSVEEYIGGVQIINDNQTYDFPDGFILPGFVDSHAHIVGLGIKLLELSLYSAISETECCERVMKQQPIHGDWITGMGWNQELWESKTFPTKFSLDKISPTTPIYLRRADGHAAWVNSYALQLAGIDETTQDPVGGLIVRDSEGNATGVLIDNAMYLVSHLIPQPSNNEIRTYIQTALTQCSKHGLTEIHDMDVPPEYIEIYREMAEQGLLSCRVQTWVKGQHDEWSKYGILPAVGEFQQTIGVKFYSDGALGSHGAWLLEKYSDAPETVGLALITYDELLSKSTKAIENGFHVCTHAIGSAANRLVLNVYKKLRSEGIASKDVLLRVEHSQIVHPEDLQTFEDYHLVASVQPIHCSSDARMAEKRLSDRCEYSYPWKTLIDKNVLVCGGSDFPIESHIPLMGIYSFCTRFPFGEQVAWFEHEIITREQAIACYTTNAHKAADVDYRRGRLEIGQDADFVVWDTDLHTCTNDELLRAQVLATFVAGKCVYKRE